MIRIINITYEPANVCKIKIRLVEETSESFIFGFFLFFFLLGGGRGGSCWCVRGGGNRSRASIGIRVGNAIFQIVYFGPAVLSLNCDSQNLLVAVNNGVDNRWEGWEVGGQGDSSNGGDSAAEGLEELRLLNIKNTSGEGVSLVINLGDTHSVGEGRDVQHVEQGSLGSSDLAASLDQLQIGCNFDGTTSNLGWNTKSLEERGLSGFHTSVSCGNVDIGGSNGSSSGGSSNLVGENLVADSLELGVGEDEADIALDVREETLIFWIIADEAFDSTTNHGVLSHQYDTLSAERMTDLVHLLGADIVDADDEDGLVFLEEALELLEVAGLVC